MMRATLAFIICILFMTDVHPAGLIDAMGDETIVSDDITDTSSAVPISDPDTEIAPSPSRTPCATAVMSNALAAAGGNISESAPESAVRDWIYNTLRDGNVITAIMNCPELDQISPDETIVFDPIHYTFAGGREITIQRETQPRVLERQLLLSHKRDIPSSPRIGADGAIWTNVDPAWYAILVVQSGTLDNFVGPGRSNTVSLDYINQHIDTLYPAGPSCTSRSALANDDDMINIAVHETVSIQDDTNDYYVAGDVNLQWITWGEVALDVVITVATAGGGAAILGATKGARATRAAKNLVATIKNLERTDTVRDYIRIGQQHARMAEQIKTIDRTTDAARYADITRDMNTAATRMRELEQMDDVRDWRRATNQFSDIMKYRGTLRGLQTARRGNVITRAWRAARAAGRGEKNIRRATRAGRASMQSGRVRDWLFQSTMKNAGRLGRVMEQGGIIYGAIQFIGNMYDWSETSTGDFTHGIDFKPLGLLSADDITGQENVVNHGMWLMWTGHSTSAADDDAAFLQAMDFATKFHMDLMDTMAAHENNACDVDIYVVRPVLRNPDEPGAALYYLIMNDEPWSTRP